MKTVNAYLAHSSNIAARLYVSLVDSTECLSSGAAPGPARLGVQCTAINGNSTKLALVPA